MPRQRREQPPRGLVVYCADIGSVAKRRFGWARQRTDGAQPAIRRGTDISKLVQAVAADLNGGRSVALGFECPLFVPIRDNPEELTSAREGEGNRPWSAGAGAAVLATALTECVWILRALRRQVSTKVSVFLTWDEFCEASGGLFLWEAFVSSRAKGKSHQDDAAIAVRSFAAQLPDLKQAIPIWEAVVHSLVGAALLGTEWSSDTSLLRKACLVIKA